MRICLIGSARFEDAFKSWNKALTLAGHTVYSLAVYPSDEDSTREWYKESEKELLDLVHLNKILNSDAVVCIDSVRCPNEPAPATHYVGESTRRELLWTRMQNKHLLYTTQTKLADAHNLLKMTPRESFTESL